jgi:hypothetical protein
LASARETEPGSRYETKSSIVNDLWAAAGERVEDRPPKTFVARLAAAEATAVNGETRAWPMAAAAEAIGAAALTTLLLYPPCSGWPAWLSPVGSA